jgi:hypothetical protein
MFQNVVALLSLIVAAIGLYYLIVYVKATKIIATQSMEQSEATSRPAVVAKGGPSVDDSPILVNIGNGPAIELQWSIPNTKLQGVIPYLTQQQTHTLSMNGVKPLFIAGMKDEKNESGIECIYSSLSRRTYASSNKYDYEGAISSQRSATQESREQKCQTTRSAGPLKSTNLALTN